MVRMPPVETEWFPVGGGLDQQTPRISLPPGRARSAQNYVGVVSGNPKNPGGYRRFGGYVRYDGRSKPNNQTYTMLYPTTTFGGASVGDTVNGQTSGATAKIIEIGTGGTYYAVTRVTGTFVAGENIRKVTTVLGVYTLTTSVDLSSSDDNRLQNLVEDDYRASIAVVPGSGAVRGVFEYGGTLYAFRDNAGATACVLHKEHATTGWTSVAFGHTLNFNSGGTTEITVGSAIDNGAGATATVRRVFVQSGSWGAGDAAGYVVLSGLSGAWAIADPIEIGATNVGTATSATTAITLSPGGKYDIHIHNFTGNTDTKRVYGADGVNNAFEFDGTYYVPIRTGMTTDTPNHAYGHQNQLFLSFRGSVQHSGIGDPTNWSVVTGAAMLGTGDDVTGFLSVPGSQDGGALAIFCQNKTFVLYGTSVANWKLIPFSAEVGAAAWSMQTVAGRQLFMDEVGITTLGQSQNYGNFTSAAITDRVQSLVTGKADNVETSLVSRSGGLYMLFFDDMTGVSVTIGAGGVECIMPIVLLVQPNCAWETTRNGGEMFIGCDDGYVYQLEAGRSFDGEVVEAFLSLAFNHSKSPRTRKTYRRAVMEMTGRSYCSVSVSASLDYDDADVPVIDSTDVEVAGSGGRYDVATWDSFYWDSRESSSPEVSLSGHGSNISFRFYSASDEELPHTIQGVIVHYTQRRLER